MQGNGVVMSKIAVLGYGVVGSGVVELFYKNKESILCNTTPYRALATPTARLKKTAMTGGHAML